MTSITTEIDIVIRNRIVKWLEYGKSYGKIAKIVKYIVDNK